MKTTWLHGCTGVCLVLLLSGCSWPGLDGFSPHASSPASVPPRPNGTLAVAPAASFVYLPARTGRVSSNRIANSAMTSIILKQNINAAVRDAVKASLMTVKVPVGGSAKSLSGLIEQFSVDDGHFPATWTLKIRYLVTDSTTRKVIYQSSHIVHQRSAKFTSNEVALSDAVNLSVKKLVSDQAFLNAIR